MRIKDIPEENRPRERLQRYGAGALSDAELLALVLKTGSKTESVVDMANRLLAVHDLDTLASCSLKELQQINGIGAVKASQIVAVFELNKRRTLTRRTTTPITSAEQAFLYGCKRLSDMKRECFLLLHLDAKHRIVKDEIISLGTVNASLVHPREVFRSAIRESAYAVLLLHNHPSGDPTPSGDDTEVTTALFSAGELLGIPVLDHVIVGNGCYYSFKEA